MTNREKAQAWMREQCGSGDGPRLGGDPDDDSGCDCLDALTKLLDEAQQEALREAKMTEAIRRSSV